MKKGYNGQNIRNKFFDEKGYINYIAYDSKDWNTRETYFDSEKNLLILIWMSNSKRNLNSFILQYFFYNNNNWIL